jgi:glycosyltransferase involved in cell wall biosynthesis
VRVLLLTQLFQPEPNHLKGLEFAKAVRAAGIDLRVLTGFPNYPGGRIYPGYRVSPVLHQVLDGVPVTRVAMFPSHDRSAARRAATYLSFAASATVAASLGRFTPHILHAYVGPMTLAIPAAAVRALRGARVLLDIQDLWPESVAASGMGRQGLVIAASSALCRWAYRRSDRFLVLSHGYKRVLCERGVPEDRVDVVYNWCDETQVPHERHSSEQRTGSHALRVLYAGNVGALQGLDVVLDAARVLAGRGIAVEFTIAGTGVELTRLRARQERETITNVRFIGSMPREAMPSLYEETDALLVHLRDDPLSRIGIPQKTQMSLAAGRPILMGVRGEATGLVVEAGAAVTFEPGSAIGLADAAARLAAMPPAERDHLAASGQRFYSERLSFQRGVEGVLRVYNAMAGCTAA